MIVKAGLLCLCLALAAACGGSKTSTLPSSVAGTGAAVTPAQVTSQASPSGSPSADATPAAIAPRIGAPIPFPDDVALIIETGCWGCDGDYGRLVRIYADAKGAFQETALLRGSPSGAYTVSLDGAQVAQSWCSRGTCGPYNPPSPDVQTTIRWSHDGGITSTVLGPIDGEYDVAAVTTSLLIVTGFSSGSQPLLPRLFPGGDVFTPPPGAAHPVVIGTDEIGWVTTDRTRVLDAAGKVLIELGAGEEIHGIAPSGRGDDRLEIEWTNRDASNSVRLFRSIVSRDGSGFRIQRTYAVDAVFGSPGGWLDRDTMLGTYGFRAADLPSSVGSPGGELPALFDINTGVLRPILEPFASKPPYVGGRNIVLAVMRGPFARVTNTGSCLNVRAEPAGSAASLDCAADGVLLRPLGDERAVGGATWLRVATPAGIEGWASAEFIER
jgi:hypothetical protein